MSLLVAGHETTVAELSNSVYVLLAQPTQVRCARAPGQAAAGGGGAAALIPLSTLTLPIVATKISRWGIVTVRSGECVLPVRAAANRDERAFADPGHARLRPATAAAPTCSYGARHCIGAALARMELQVALGALLGRFPA